MVEKRRCGHRLTEGRRCRRCSDDRGGEAVDDVDEVRRRRIVDGRFWYT
jgi:hypothetical protein